MDFFAHAQNRKIQYDPEPCCDKADDIDRIIVDVIPVNNRAFTSKSLLHLPQVNTTEFVACISKKRHY